MTIWIVKGITQNETQTDFIDSVWITKNHAMNRAAELADKISSLQFQFEIDEYAVQGEPTREAAGRKDEND